MHMDVKLCALGILLAGGKSSRMGSDKALLSLNHQTLLEQQTRLLETCADRVLISRNEPEFIQDIYTDSGPLAGLHAVLTHALETDENSLSEVSALVAPVDMPLLTAELLNHLASEGQRLEASAFYLDQPLPIYIHNAAEALSVLEAMLSSGQRIVSTFLEGLGAKSVPTAADAALANANTPMQWKLISRKML